VSGRTPPRRARSVRSHDGTRVGSPRTLSAVEQSSRRAHWDERYRTVGPERVSWFETEPVVSLQVLDALGVEPPTSVIDVGGGASALVDRLVDRGFGDVTVLDVSAEALAVSRSRVASPAVTWLQADLLNWVPERRYGLWHDRAVFHFLDDAAERERYLAALRSAVEPGGWVVLATFARDGPETCSGLPVHRYDAAALAAVLGSGFELVSDRREDHVTPSGSVQHFTWAAFRATPHRMS
jgi:SAM-dependent methyltransferase